MEGGRTKPGTIRYKVFALLPCVLEGDVPSAGVEVVADLVAEVARVSGASSRQEAAILHALGSGEVCLLVNGVGVAPNLSLSSPVRSGDQVIIAPIPAGG